MDCFHCRLVFWWLRFIKEMILTHRRLCLQGFLVYYRQWRYLMATYENIRTRSGTNNLKVRHKRDFLYLFTVLADAIMQKMKRVYHNALKSSLKMAKFSFEEIKKTRYIEKFQSSIAHWKNKKIYLKIEISSLFLNDPLQVQQFFEKALLQIFRKRNRRTWPQKASKGVRCQNNRF